MRTVTFLFVDQSSLRRLEQVGEDTLTSPDNIEAYIPNFKQKLKFLQLSFFRGTPDPVGACARKSTSISNASKNLEGAAPPKGQN